MPKCSDCELLDGANVSVEPHANLRELEHKEYRGTGMRRTMAVRYRCSRCATAWLRDLDPGDRHAPWEEVRGGQDIDG